MITLRYFSAAILYFVIAVTLGVVLSIDPYLIGFRTKAAHAHIALIGWVTLTIMGAMYQIVPTILGGQLHSQRLAGYQFWLMNLGLLGLFLSFLAGAKTVVLFGVITALAGYLFVYIMYRTLRTEQKTKQPLDISVKYFIAALVYFLIVLALGIVLSIDPYLLPGRAITAHAHIALIGWVSITIVGAMYHLVPMLAWMERYADKLGTQAVPTIKELYSERAANAQFWLLNLGLLGFFSGLLALQRMLVTASGALIALAAYYFAYEMYKLLYQRK